MAPVALPNIIPMISMDTESATRTEIRIPDEEMPISSAVRKAVEPEVFPMTDMIRPMTHPMS